MTTPSFPPRPDPTRPVQRAEPAWASVPRVSDSAAASGANLDPDVRFLLANERTLLAWLRTSVTLQAAGVGILHFAPSLDVNGVIGLSLLLVGALCGVSGYRRYQSADQAIRRGTLPGRGRAPAAISSALVVIAVALLVIALGDQLG